MVTEQQIHDQIEKCKNSGMTYAEFIAEIFKDKFIEIYVGDTYEEVSTEQVSVEYPAVFCGRVVGAYRECIIIDAAYVNESKKVTLGNFLFLNERAIRALNPLTGAGVLEDMFLRSKEALLIKNFFRP